MRILHLGDTHLGRVQRTWNGPPGWSRADDHHAAFAAALAPALREEVDLVVHAGDLFDRSRPPMPAVRAAARLLRQVAERVPVVVLAGNHDRRGLRTHLGSGSPGLHVVDAASRLRVAGLWLALVPHHRQAHGWGTAAREAVGGGVDLLVTHQGFAGARVPGFTFRVGLPAETVDARHLPTGVPAVLNGHIHPRQVVDCRGVPVVYPGSTERTSGSEAGQTKGYAVWSLGRDLGWRFADLASRPLRRVEDASSVGAVSPGELVSLPLGRLRDLAPAVAARGGIVALPPSARERGPGRQQLRLPLG
jgi:DNA repair exonuclease SbcCD nuclease subunit